MSEDKFTRLSTQDNFVSEKIDIIKNNLLGSYDDENEYFIAPQIIKELKELKKYKKSSFNNSAFCAGNLMGYGEIFFELEFDDQTTEDNQGKANFYVLENVDKINGYLQNVIRTKIGEFIAPLEDFIAKSYAFFNIFDDEESDEGKEKKTLEDLETDDSFILAKKQYSLMMDKLSDEKVLDAYGAYFSAKISLLTSSDNEFCKTVLERFNQEYELIEKLFLSNKNYKVLNELVDKCLEEVSGTKEIYIEQENAFREALAPKLDEFTNSVDILNEKIEEKALSMLSKDDQNKVNEIIDSEEEHNRQIKEDDSPVLETSNDVENTIQSTSNTIIENENTINSFNPTEVQEEPINVEVLDDKIQQPEPLINQPQESSSNNVDMDMMRSMFGIDPTFVDERPIEEPKSSESTDIMDMFRKKAEILANSPEYNGSQGVKTEEGTLNNLFGNEEILTEVSEVPVDNNSQATNYQEGLQPSTIIEEERPQLQQSDVVEEYVKEEHQEVQSNTPTQTTTEVTAQARREQEIRNMNDVFNTLRAMAKEKTSLERIKEEQTSKDVQSTSQTSQVEDVGDKSSALSSDNYFDKSEEISTLKHFDSLVEEYSAENVSIQGDIGSYYNSPTFEDEASIKEDELYSDGLGGFIGDKFEQPSQEIEEVDSKPKSLSNDLGDMFSTVQDTIQERVMQ